jgi:hypothetical protein
VYICIVRPGKRSAAIFQTEAKKLRGWLTSKTKRGHNPHEVEMDLIIQVQADDDSRPGGKAGPPVVGVRQGERKLERCQHFVLDDWLALLRAIREHYCFRVILAVYCYH